METKFWLKDYTILLDGFMDFFPSKSNTIAENLNSIVRLTFYISLVLSIYYKQNYFHILVMGLLFTLFIYKTNTIENFELNPSLNCTAPTLDNPFMNVSYVDYIENPDRPPACNINDPEIKKEIDDGFYNNLFRETSDLFGKMNSQRQFYTMPSTTIPNDRESFMNWCYNIGPTCKESGTSCLRYEDLRAKKPIYPNPYENPF